MKFSVLIPICNKEKAEYLKEAIESIIHQTVKPNQIVVVKDGKLSSKLNEIVEIYQKQYPELIDVLELKKQSSLGLVLNEGIKVCKNSYVARMDSDDVARKDRFEKQLKYLQEHSDIDLLGGYIEEYDEKMKKATSLRKVPLTQKEIYKRIIEQSPFNHSTVILKKESVLKIGGYRNSLLEDYDLWIRMRLQNMKMANLPDVLVDYRTSFDMYKRRTGLKYLKGIIEIEKLLLKSKIINKYQYLKNVLTRTMLAFVPVRIKMYLYPKVIRKIFLGTPPQNRLQ